MCPLFRGMRRAGVGNGSSASIRKVISDLAIRLHSQPVCTHRAERVHYANSLFDSISTLFTTHKVTFLWQSVYVLVAFIQMYVHNIVFELFITVARDDNRYIDSNHKFELQMNIF